MSEKKLATQLKVMHRISKDDNGAPVITSKVTSSNPPKLREAVAPTEESKTVDKQRAAEETGHKVPKDSEVSELDHKILKALIDLGGKDVASIDIAKRAGTTRTHPTHHAHPFKQL